MCYSDAFSYSASVARQSDIENGVCVCVGLCHMLNAVIMSVLSQMSNKSRGI